MSHNRQQAISVQLSTPLWAGSQNQIVNDVTNKITGYSHELKANGGFVAADLEISDTQNNIERWLDWIGHTVTVYNDSLGTIFEGFVNNVEITIGALTVNRGPMLDIKNRVAVAYQTMSYSTNPPIGGQQAVTAYATNAASVARYGQLEGIISGGSGSATAMEQLRDTFLESNALPGTSQNVNDRQSPPSARISVRGFYDLLTCYFYSEPTGTGAINLSTKLANILAAAPSVTYTTRIATNTLQVPAFSDGQATAEGEISDLVAKGDANDDRYLFGVYAGRTAVYEAAPTDIEYRMAINDNGVVVENGAGRVMPWDVRPGRWLMVTGILVGQAETAPTGNDPRMIFIESARYTYPVGLQINGGKFGRLSQRLAKLGLGGM